MTNLTQKLKLIYLPFLIIAITIIGGYTLLNWQLYINLHLFTLREDIVNIWIPLGLPWIPILIWLRPGIKLLNLKTKKGDLPSLYILIAGLAIALPTIIAQFYLQTASGKLTQLENIKEIGRQKPTKYYTLKNFYIDKQNIGVDVSFEASGKYNENLNMKLYIAIPILDANKDTSSPNCAAWYGVKYDKQISNRLDANEKQEKFKEFANESQADFDRKDVTQFVYLDRIGNTDDHKEYDAAIKNNKKYLTNSTVVLVPVNEPFEARTGNKLVWIFGSFGIGGLIWFIMILIPGIDTSEVKQYSRGRRPKENEAKEIFSLFIPRKGFYITPILIDLNLLIFVVMIFSGLGFLSFKGKDLLDWGANFKPLTTNGEWWRLVTNTFLHGGLMHLLANMFGLLFVGVFLEPILGKARFLVIYLLTGILASLTSLWWHQNTVSVGASGAIFGLYGLFLAFLLTNVFPKQFNKAFLTSTLIFVGYNLLMGVSGGIDNAAHIGGLLSGFITGLILHSHVNKPSQDELSTQPVAINSPEGFDSPKNNRQD